MTTCILGDQKRKLLTRQEAAVYLGVKVQTLCVWACTRRYALPYIKVGRLVRYRLSDLDAFLTRRTVDGATPASAEPAVSSRRPRCA